MDPFSNEPPRLGAASWTPELGYHIYDHRQYKLPIDAQTKPSKILTWSKNKKYSNMGNWDQIDELWVKCDIVGNGVLILEEDGSWRYARVMQYCKGKHKLVYTDPSRTKWCDLKEETFMEVYPYEMAKMDSEK